MMKFLLAVNTMLRYSLIGAIMLLTGLEVNAQCTPSGNQTSSGQGQWIGYVYSNNTAFTTTPPASVSAFTYRGYTTQTENFDLNPGSGAISGTNICGSYADYFTVRFKMNKNYVAGYYSITVGADDGYRLSLDGGATFVSSLSDWALHSYSSKTATVLLNGNTDLVLEYFENAGSSRVSFNITSLSCESTAPTAVSGVTALDCTTLSTTLTATGGTHGYNATYQWGTGTVAGQNIIAGQTGAAITVTPSGTTTYWVRRVNASPCTGYSDAAFQTVTVSGRYGDPAIFGDNAWSVYAYNGGNINLSGVNYFGAYSQTGINLNTVASWNVAGSPSDAMGYQGCTVPADNFTFVAKRKGFPCGNYTLTMAQWDDEAVVYVNGTQVWYSATWSGNGTTSTSVGTFSLDANSTVEVRVREIGGNSNAVLNFVTSVPPTSITGNTALNCGVTSTTLTAAGGSINGNTTYQWGTGSVAGQNIIAGATGATITVSPATTTTYWVRLVNYNNCTPESAAVTTTVTVTPVPGNPAVFGNGVWNVYGYSGGDINLTGTTYLGYYTRNTLGLDTTASWGTAVSPSATVGWQGCAVPNDVFTVVEKRQGFPCGRYTLTMSSWDDEAAVYVNGALVWNRTSLGVSSVVGTFDLDATSTVEVRLREAYGSAYNVLAIAPSAVPPTGITGNTSLSCITTSTTLTATGGSISGTTTYQWGTGTVGQNIIAGATTASITVSPTSTTTYWVRLVNYNNCTPESAAVTTTVNVTPSPGNPAVFGNNTWNVYAYNGSNVSLTGLPYLGYYTQNTVGFNSTSSWGAYYSPSSAADYQGCVVAAENFTYVAKRSGFPCGRYNLTMTQWDDESVVYINGTQVWTRPTNGTNVAIGTYDLDANSTIEIRTRDITGASSAVLAIVPASVPPTSITGNTTLNCGVTSTTLTAAGGSISGNTTYQWGTGAVVGQNIIAGATTASITVSPTATTAYWVRLVNYNNCTPESAAVTTTVTVTPVPGDPAVFGNGAWNVYGYSGGNINLTGTTYLGYYTQNTLGLDTTTSWGIAVSPSATVGWQGCTVPNDVFTVVEKRQGFPCGRYTLTMSSWDDEIAVYVNGTLVWNRTATGSNTVVGTFDLDATSTVEVRLREAYGSAYNILAIAPSAVPPTAITGNTALSCSTTSTTLTATGGSISGNTTYQWGTGTVAGQNIISGATTASITVSPTATTTYWVRLVNYNNCTPESAAVNTTVTVTPSPGNPAVFGDNTWNVYAYNGSSVSLTNTTYLGYYTQSTLGFNSTSSWGTTVSPSSATNYQGCTVPNDNFTYIAKRQGFTCGRYTLTMTQWDDESVVYINGTQVWTRATNGTNVVVGTYDLDANSTIEIRTREVTGPTSAVLAIVPASVPPTSITGNIALSCSTTSTTLTAAGGSISGNTTYQWGTGAVAGQNIISGATTASITVSPTATTTYWVRLVNYNNCTPESAAVTTTVTVTPSPGNPAVFGNNTWNVYAYNGSSVSLTNTTYLGYYTQSTLGFNSTSSWGTSVSPSSATNYQGCTVPNDNFTYIAKRQGFTCGRYTLTMTQWDDESVVYINGTQVWTRATNGTNVVVGTYDLDANSTIEIRTREVTGPTSAVLAIVPASVPPTSITGNTALFACGSTSTTLTAAGGSISGNTTYQWGTGAVAGLNIISGATTASITVSPTATTTYWVRLVNYNNCTPESAAVTTTVTVSTVPGNPAVFGDGVWNAYGYSGTTLTLSDAVYRGYYTQSTLGFDTTTGTNSWADTASPSAATGWQGCTVPNDNFVLVYKRKGFSCGTYQISFTRWDDDAELYINGTRVWNRTSWSGGLVNVLAGTYTLNENTTIEFRVHENGGSSNATMILTPTSTLSVAPTAITGPLATLCGGSTTLTAVGGVLGTNSVYEWGTGTEGTNIIAGATTASISVTPQQNTTYWVRIKNTTCSTYTAAAYYNVQATTTVAGTLSAAVTTICKNSILSSGISLTGSVGNIVKWQSANDAAFTNGVVDIANTTTTLSGAEIGPVTAPKYFRALVQNGNCTAIATPALYINVPAPLVWNGSWNGTPTINTAVEIQSDLNLSTDLTVCSCEVKNNARFNVASGTNLTVKGKLTVAATATMVVANNASLVQIDEIANEGKIQLYRNSSLIKRFDYTLWSSPVDNQQLLAFSPQTLTDRFYEYKTATDVYGRVSPQINFETAKSYLIRTPNNHPLTVPTVFNGMFEGTPHNGTINKAVAVTGNGFNAVGNPYPSPIRVNDFINANINNMEGTLWFWRKTNDKTQSSYTTMTKLAYVANAAPGGENGYATNPGGVLNTGQGFIVKAKSTATNIVFTNAMRVGNSTNQFFRTAVSNASKYWLNITDATGSYSQTAVGYTSEATTGYDNGIDGRIYIDNNINLYTIQDENVLAIQGRPEFTDTDQVALGFKATQAGTFTINVSDTEGLFTADQAIYLVDNVEGLVVNVKAHAYTFTTDAGTFNDRFSIIYNTTTLGTNQPIADDKSTVIFGKNGILKVNAEENIKSVMVYDILGRQLLKADNVNNLTFEGNTGSTEQVLIVKVQLASGKVAERKVLLH